MQFFPKHINILFVNYVYGQKKFNTHIMFVEVEKGHDSLIYFGFMFILL